MAGPTNILGATKSFVSGNTSLLSPIFFIGTGMLGAKHRISQGESPMMAYGKELALAGLYSVMPLAAAITLQSIPILPAITEATIRSYRATSAKQREVTVPFCKRYEHTEVSSESLRRGMDAINNSRAGIGSEAFNMHKRYGR